MNSRSARTVLGGLAFAALAAATGDAGAQATAPKPLLRNPSPELAAKLEDLPPFLADTKLGLNLRTYYRNNEPPTGNFQRAWAGGGALYYQSGWLADIFSIGAVGYSSIPLWAPERYDGTKLLAPGQDPINVVGEAYAKLRYADQYFTGWRQKVDVGYVNPQDNRMVPNTFEAAMFEGRYGWFSYDAGYLWGMKPREGTSFIPLSQAAGARDTDEGGWLGGIRLTPWEPFFFELNGIYVTDTIGTTFANTEYVHKVSPDLLFGFGAQYTDQRSLGSNLIGDFKTWNVGGRVRGLYRGVGLELVLAQTGDDASIASPFGSYPGYLSLVNKDFTAADQTSWGVKLTNDFANVGAPGLTGFFWYADGSGASPDFREYDFSLTYAPTRDVFDGHLYGFSIRGVVALVDQEGVSGILPDYRVIVNYAIPLL